MALDFDQVLVVLVSTCVQFLLCLLLLALKKLVKIVALLQLVSQPFDFCVSLKDCLILPIEVNTDIAIFVPSLIIQSRLLIDLNSKLLYHL